METSRRYEYHDRNEIYELYASSHVNRKNSLRMAAVGDATMFDSVVNVLMCAVLDEICDDVSIYETG